MLRLANIEDWETSKYTGRRLRDAAYVIHPDANDSSSESEPEVNVPLNKLAQKYRHKRERL